MHVEIFWRGRRAVLGFESRALHLLVKYSTTWATSSAFFWSNYFEDKVLLFDQTSMALLFYTSHHCWDDRHISLCPDFSVKVDSHELFCVDWPNPSDLRLPHILDDKHIPLHLAIGLDGVSLILCLRWPQTMILPISTSQVGRITGMSHQCRACVRYF
jgi:hypothetical protein